MIKCIDELMKKIAKQGSQGKTYDVSQYEKKFKRIRKETRDY